MYEEVRAHLLDERNRIVSQIERLDDTDFGLGTQLTDSISELSSYDNHPADHATETFERSKDFALKDAARIQIAMIDYALSRLDNGTYTKCSKCGIEIGSERLAAIPYTSLCISCKATDEELLDMFVRPIEEKVLRFPFGRSFKDGTDYVAYDGEDAWQDVARYGSSESPQDVPGSVRFPVYVDPDEDHGIVSQMDAIIDEPNNEDIPPEPWDIPSNEYMS